MKSRNILLQFLSIHDIMWIPSKRGCFLMRVANRALKTAVAEFEGLSDIADIYTLRDAGRRFGVARNTVTRWSDLGIFVAKTFVFKGQSYRYYTGEQCDCFERTDFYKSLPRDGSSAYTKISTTVHDFLIPGELVVFTPAEFAEKVGLSLQSVERMDRSGKFVAKRVVKNNRTYRYYTKQQCEDFMSSAEYQRLSRVKNADLIGTYIGKLYIAGYSSAAVRKGYYGSYRCECDCGNVVDLPRSELLAGKAKSCGCKFHDLSGMDFGWWHVDSLAPCSVTTNGQRVFRYNCTCICGKKSVVFATSLPAGHSQSCGCRVEPIGESHIRTYLQSLGLTTMVDDSSDGYVQHKRYDDLRGVGGNPLSYDFYVRFNSDEWLIEYQGLQHYCSVDYFGGDEQFEKQVEHDRRKREYATRIGISLIEISYKYATYDDIANELKKFGVS